MRTLLAALTALMLFATPAVARSFEDADTQYKFGQIYRQALAPLGQHLSGLLTSQSH